MIARLLLCCWWWLSTVWCPTAQAQMQSPLQLLQNVQSSLVEVRAVSSRVLTRADGSQIHGTYHAEGSGVILDSYGTIVTNTHIINGAEHIYVGLSDGTMLEAKLVHSSDADFSFIKVDPPYPLTPIAMADSSDVQIGTPVITLGYDNNDQQHVLSGAITNLVDGVDSNNVELIELNFDLHPGDSGGPLLDNQGHLLGIIMAKRASQEDKTYAIASDKIQQEYQQYQQNLPT